jgi:hypothetical protein
MSAQKPFLARWLRRIAAVLVLGGVLAGAVGILARDPDMLAKSAAALAAGLGALLVGRARAAA